MRPHFRSRYLSILEYDEENVVINSSGNTVLPAGKSKVVFHAFDEWTADFESQMSQNLMFGNLRAAKQMVTHYLFTKDWS
jgi:hypothetical protein